MTQTFADELFNNLNKLKGGYKLKLSEPITLDGNFHKYNSDEILYIYGLDYNIEGGTNKGNFIIGEKVAEIHYYIRGLLSATTGSNYLTLNFDSNTVSGIMDYGSGTLSFNNANYDKIYSVITYSVSHPYPALFITASFDNINNGTYISNLNTAINNINPTILSEGVIYTIPDFVKE